MELLKTALDLFLHLDRHLGAIIADWGAWTYVLLTAVIFCETGLVVTPFLPGDSLLFAVGAFCALGALRLDLVLGLLIVAAVAGDTVNYWIGHAVGPRVFTRDSRFLNRAHLARTQAFYEQHGGATIIIARFMPIIRTFAPFVAGIGKMHYGRFLTYNVVGGVLWIVLFCVGGYLFGNVPLVKKNFSLVILGIIVLSVLPGVVEYLRHRRAAATRRG